MSVPAFKEWAVIVRALLAGEQILDVRKGGLREDGRHFDVKSARVWLYPTTEHQQRELLKPAYQRWIDETDAGPVRPDVIRIAGWADIVGVAQLTEPADLAKIAGKFIWTLDYAEKRLSWKRRDPLWVLALRAHRLLEPIEVPWREEYGGGPPGGGVDRAPPHPAPPPRRAAPRAEARAGRPQPGWDQPPGPLSAPAARGP